MSIQELKQAVHELPLLERSALLAELAVELQAELAALHGRAASDPANGPGRWLETLTPDQDAHLNRLIQRGIDDAEAGDVADGDLFMTALRARVGARP